MVFDPSPNMPEPGDFIGAMRQNVGIVRRAQTVAEHP